MARSLFFSLIAGMLPSVWASPTAGQNRLDGLNRLDERLGQMRQALDEMAQRAEARARQQTSSDVDKTLAGGLGVSEISLPGQRPLQRLMLAGGNVVGIPLVTTLMISPAGWFHNVNEPEKYRHGKLLIDTWLSTTNPQRHEVRRPQAATGNPLNHCVAYLQAGMKFIETDVQTCSYVLYKRERISGRMQDIQQMKTWVRFDKDESGAPQLAEVLAEYLAPKNRVGRRIEYRPNEDDGKMLVRESQGLARHLTFKISPDSLIAKLESRYSIADTGPLSAVQRLMTYLDSTIRIDPDGEFTEVRYFKDSKVAGRACFAVVIRFREQRPGLDRQKAVVFVDSETYLPVYLSSYDWPKSPGEAPQLLEEFIYTDLRFNTDAETHDSF